MSKPLITKEQLQVFSDPYSTRYYCSQPFIYDGAAYSTNGDVLVTVGAGEFDPSDWEEWPANPSTLDMVISNERFCDTRIPHEFNVPKMTNCHCNSGVATCYKEGSMGIEGCVAIESFLATCYFCRGTGFIPKLNEHTDFNVYLTIKLADGFFVGASYYRMIAEFFKGEAVEIAMPAIDTAPCIFYSAERDVRVFLQRCLPDRGSLFFDHGDGKIRNSEGEVVQS